MWQYEWIIWYIPPLMPFSTINNASISVKRSNFTLVFFKVGCYANRGAVEKPAGLSSYISRHIFRKFTNTLANNNVWL